jgi:malate synthase
MSLPHFAFSMPVSSAYAEILTIDALDFLYFLEKEFGERRIHLLKQREKVQSAISAGEFPQFLAKTEEIRADNWCVVPPKPDLTERRVEITGPVERKMIINALNSGANVFMADFEDSNSPTWDNCLQGQINLRDAVNKTIQYEQKETGKIYTLQEKTATLMVRPRGWHLDEKHVLLNGRPISASLFDFALFFAHNAKTLLAQSSGPYFYLPKLESHLEARLWNDVFVAAQNYFEIPQGSIRATVLIETITAAFEMDEILYELRHHSAGLNCGRWDYIFSMIKKFRKFPQFVFPDRAQVTMTQHFLKSYVDLLIKTCHRRGAHAMGGMAAQIPIKGDPVANEEVFKKVREDKLREVRAGLDGTWVAHPALVEVARHAFDEFMKTPNQLSVVRNDVSVTQSDLLTVPQGTITEHGLRTNITVGIQYLAAWLQGNGCVPIHHLMEDAATAEICRSQCWQWLHYNCKLEDDRVIDRALFENLLLDELNKIAHETGEKLYNDINYQRAATIFSDMIQRKQYDDFLTSVAYHDLA